ncbi:MAG: radical SAM protein [Oscillospiraceae bacterium]|nr:radical SAM protein [Oscillospiraceae bacterium]
MNLTLHLTENCNMNCAYCVREKQPIRMSEAVADAAVDLAFSSGKSAGLCFFGGEPLLESGLIYRAIRRCMLKTIETGKPAYYKMTTNGTLLTERFLENAHAVHMGIGLSFEGLAQDTCRRFKDGAPSFDVVEEKAKLLLKHMPDAYAMMTIAPQAVPQYAESVKYLRSLGFKRITSTIAYGKKVHWTDDDLALLKGQMEEIAAFFEAEFLKGDPFFFSPLDAKIRDFLRGFNPSERCHLGFRQMPVAPDGSLYACTQFIGDPDYKLGDVFHGVDRERQKILASRAATPESCKECALRTRCTNSCGCTNRLETGNENTVSPLQCSYERMTIALADEVADRLYAADEAAFKKRFAADVPEKDKL